LRAFSKRQLVQQPSCAPFAPTIAMSGISHRACYHLGGGSMTRGQGLDLSHEEGRHRDDGNGPEVPRGSRGSSDRPRGVEPMDARKALSQQVYIPRTEARERVDLRERSYRLPALDDDDVRSLIIDQPEERAGSVGSGGQATPTGHHGHAQRQSRHQHGRGPDHRRGSRDGERRWAAADSLPSGSLDEKPIWTVVCNILEGGELSFRGRARRLRIGLKR
jgi:hypothetical protein